MKTINKKIQKQIEKLPKTEGVYLFYNKSIIIYIGKAINIKDRVKNHFSQPSYRDKLFINKVSKIKFIETNSEIEALVLEANLIKKHLPKFNVVWRDDKNYFYVAIEKKKDGAPYVFITHQPRRETWNIKHETKNEYIGPFVEGGALKKTLKYLRRVFPYYTAPRHSRQKCTWCHLDLCPGPTPSLTTYRKNLKKLILILQGKRKNVVNLLKKKMTNLVKEKKFEEAAKIRDKINALQKIIEHAKVIEGSNTPQDIARPDVAILLEWEKTQKVFQRIFGVKKHIKRIECYDISNIQGKFATGSMVVFINGKPDKSQYKRFRIKTKNEPDDIAMLKELLQRRFVHTEWNYPEIILIDGGVSQRNIAIITKKQKTITKNIKVISIAKGRQELFIEGRNKPIPLKNLPQEIYNLIKHLDDEAHRFAIAYHKKLYKRSLGLTTTK